MTRAPTFAFSSHYQDDTHYLVHAPPEAYSYRVSYLRRADPLARRLPLPEWSREIAARVGYLTRCSNPDASIPQDVFRAFLDWYRANYDDEPPLGTARAVFERWPGAGLVLRRWERRDRDGNPVPDYPDPLTQGPTAREIEDAAARASAKSPPPPHRTAEYEAGWTAYHQGQAVAANPHEDATGALYVRRYDWRAGWFDAELYASIDARRADAAAART